MVIAAAIALASGDVWAQEPTRQELRRVFEQLLQDPTNTDLNFRYASLARERGELRKALAAYERILATDPDNEEAQDGIRRVKRLLEPDATEITVVIGGQYESNPQHEVDTNSGTDDSILVGRVVGTDERKFGETRWRTSGDLFSNWHAKFGEIDFLNVGVRTGPVFELTEGWDIHPAVGASYAILDSEEFFYEGAFSVAIEATNGGIFQSLNLRAAFDQIDDEIAGRNAYVLEINPRFVITGLATANDSLILNPLYRFNGTEGSGGTGTGASGDTFPLNYQQFGGRVDYYFPITPEIYLGVNLTGYYEDYNESVIENGLETSEDREDIYLSPGAQVIFSRVFLENHDVVISYQYETNLSNDEFEDFENHIAGVRSVWRF